MTWQLREEGFRYDRNVKLAEYPSRETWDRS